MFSILSLLSGAALAGLVYGFSFLPSATLARCDDIACADDGKTLADKGDAVADATQTGSKRDSA